MTSINVEFTNTKRDQPVDASQISSQPNSFFIDYGDYQEFNIKFPINSVNILIRGGDGVMSTTVSPLEENTFNLTQLQIIALVVLTSRLSKVTDARHTTINSSNGALKELIEGLYRNR